MRASTTIRSRRDRPVSWAATMATRLLAVCDRGGLYTIEIRLSANLLTRILERIKQMTQPGRLKFWQGLTVGLMVLGYAGYYLCRSNLAVMLLSIAEELTTRGLATSVAVAKERLGWAVSLGTVGYAVGKFAAGSLVDLLGGRRNYLIGMAGAVACTILFALGGSIPIFTFVWFMNRLIQSLGWPGMIKITSRWFSYASYGTVMGVISLSFLFGDALARAFMGRLIEAGFGWRGVFGVTAGVLGALWILNFALIRESPGELGLPEPETNPDNLFGELGQDPHPEAAGPLWETSSAKPGLLAGLFAFTGRHVAARELSIIGHRPIWWRELASKRGPPPP